MARLQILELPEGASDDRAPFVLVVDQFDSPFLNSSFDEFAKNVGARGIVATTGTIDIPSNDVPLDANGQPLFRAQVEEQINYALGRVTRAVNAQNLADERTEIAHDADRLAKWKNELTEALGIAPTRDWDDIRNAATGIRRNRDAQAAELERLRASEEPVTDKAIRPTPGQWIWQWNRATPEKRLAMAAQILDGMARANDCFMADHEAQIASLRAEVERLRTERSTTETPDA